MTQAHPATAENQLTAPSESEIETASRHSAEPILSKTQQKKLLKRQKWLQTRPERRKLEREKKKLKRQQAAMEKAAVDSGDNQDDTPDMLKTHSKKVWKTMKESQNKFRVVIDLDFEDYMTENEISKATQQVGRIYSLNRHSDQPCQLYISSLKGKILDRFAITNAGFKSWDINHSEKDYLELFDDRANDIDFKKQFIYLSGDADETLPSVEDLLKDETKIFVIGGLVDHNRHKNLCYMRAREKGIPTARLPVQENVTLCQRHIFSTVTVFEIMLQVLCYKRSWGDALRSAIPKRKLLSSDASDVPTEPT